MNVRKILLDIENPIAVDQAFAAIEAQPIASCNWPEKFPYTPKVTYKMFHTGEQLLLRFEVEERYTAARVTADNGEVWTDSCVEFFLAPDNTGFYNFETTCIGRMLLGWRISRNEGVVHATPEVLASVVRHSTLPNETFEEREGDNRWAVTLKIPITALFKHHFTSWDGAEMRMNLYKCGDKLSHPHFLSWRPIVTESPDFHRPEFFETVIFDAE